MLRQTINYTDFDNNDATTDLWFNITRTEMTDQLHRLPEVEAIQKMIVGDGSEREMKPEEIKRILDMVKTFAALAYGERSEDGRKFRKEDPVTGRNLWDEFKTTAEYDAFMTQLFNPPENAVAFMLNVIPTVIREEAVTDYLAKNPDDPQGVVAAIKQAQETGTVEQPMVIPEPQRTDASETVELPQPPVAPREEAADDQRTQDSYTREEKLAMSQDEFDRIFGTDTTKWSQATLMVAYQRKNQQQ